MIDAVLAKTPDGLFMEVLMNITCLLIVELVEAMAMLSTEEAHMLVRTVIFRLALRGETGLMIGP